MAPASLAQADEKLETLFREGRASMDAHDYDKACSLFKESLDLGAPVGALLNLAECEDKRGHVARSLSLWKEGLSKLPAEDPRRDIATRQIADVDQRVGKIAIVWPGAPSNARGFVDGRAVTLGGDPEPVDPGTHRVTLTSSEGSSAVEVSVKSGELRTVDASAGHHERGKKNLGLLFGGAISLGIAGGASVGALVSGIVYLGAKSTVDERCPDRSHCNDADALAARDRAVTSGAVNVGMFVIAGLGLGVGIPLVVVHATSSNDPAPTPKAALQLTGSGLSLVGSF